MTVQEILKELEKLGDANTKKVLMTHGAKEPFFGVKVADLKNILKKTKKNHQLALDLYKTGNSDAMYLAGLMADETKVTKEQLEEWVEQAYWYYLSEFAVPWVTAESKYGFDMGIKWIASDKETIASAGWATLAQMTSLQQYSELDIEAYSKLLDKIEKEIGNAQPRVKYTMNGFVIAVGANIEALRNKAIKVAEKNGKVSVDMRGTACKVPVAKDYIQKLINEGRAGKKRKSFRN
ncbi:MAG: DNA alkylation repair protein [Bacteroidetes bacterium RIFOXYA12_FULL_35_11]|nr:MAG: DNA alkylation repair protein [Bacteroidetes bacterium GWF2_35_48]OFY75751.1 MAG: DNA alkylation repair protein [Bacteroidetes bacterium RIFOXYA12_FULL_35_11]OFY97526.1 MAG: DNA alkylation repair protein [Bacteroidetes bacterium RIFOXYC12_FULL_35_7]OFY97719.1 MAG: DNA alkylation repair protein [Bacteroidetes bacterium RIFOXYB2_FULL_35_7]HBX51521.1 DNA alkylation repair protein [Bacteroidales bacterium]